MWSPQSNDRANDQTNPQTNDQTIDPKSEVAAASVDEIKGINLEVADDTRVDECNADDSANAPTSSTEPATEFELVELENDVILVLQTVFDPEIPVSIYELGLIYDVRVTESRQVEIKMTLTSPACPVAGSLPPEVEHKVQSLPNVAECQVNIVWDPPWSPDMMSEAAKLELNMFW